MKRNWALIGVAILLSACSTNYPQLMSADAPPPSNAGSPGELDRILAAAFTLQKSYATGYVESAKWQDYGQLPIIGAAAAAAWILLEDGNNAATQAGKIGIGAGAYSAARGQLTSPGLTDAYIAGHGALTCVISEGSMFAGTGAQERHQEFDDLLQELANRIDEVSAYRWFSPTDAANHAELLKTVRAIADQAIVNARLAETAALVQYGAFRTAAPVFRNSVAAVSVRVASKGRVRPAIDFATLQASMSPPKSTATGTAESIEREPIKDTATMVPKLIDATNALISETGRLTSATPGYTQSLTRVAACPDQIK